MDEKLVDIEGAPGYQISDAGRVYRTVGGQGSSPGPIKSTPNKSGYHTVSLRVGGRTITRYVHDLVGRHFIKGYKPGVHVNHRDRDRNNNSIKNLEFMDGQDNKGHGKLSARTIHLIKELGRKHSVRRIASMLKLRPGVVTAVLRNGV